MAPVQPLLKLQNFRNLPHGMTNLCLATVVGVAVGLKLSYNRANPSLAAINREEWEERAQAIGKAQLDLTG